MGYLFFHYTFTAESDSERILKIGQHLPKLGAIKYRVIFYETRCSMKNVMLDVDYRGLGLNLD